MQADSEGDRQVDSRHVCYPAFEYWPHQSSKLHQQMWWEWVKRAYQGGMRVMVALAVSSETLAQILNGNQPYDDKSSADKQICAMKRFVAQHADFMEIAYSARDARRIVGENKLAVILGMEVDRLGNFRIGKTKKNEVAREIDRLHGLGIRYAFPIHLIDNAFGGTAVYNALFNLANRNINGNFFSVSHSPEITYSASLIEGAPHAENAIIWGVAPLLAAIGNMPAPCLNHIKCFPTGMLKCCERFERIRNLLKPSGNLDVYHAIKPGHVNSKGLSKDGLGAHAITQMMRHGWIIDVDHMSERSLRDTIDMAKKVPGQYPLVMGHNGMRRPKKDMKTPMEKDGEVNERSAPVDVLKTIANMGGMLGVGSANASPIAWAESYARAREHISAPGALAIGSDADGFEPLPHRYGEDDNESDAKVLQHSNAVGSADFYKKFFEQQHDQQRSLGFGVTSKQRRPNGKEWDYVTEGGVVHYGLMPEFLYEVSTTTCRASEVPGGVANCGPSVYRDFMKSAEYFVNMWDRIERAKSQVR